MTTSGAGDYRHPDADLIEGRDRLVSTRHSFRGHVAYR